ncbi:SHSP domain-containing protein [Citrus sinensis]|uniref:SHSP domain-containing protein n=1 Tax=Citrus sinensis TaxID=2711 RepID=A0ACB8P421_CITSI|nr:SHSP domain-containing protein [Citrus sinensis]
MDIAELRNMGIDQSIINHLHEILDFTDEAEPDRSHHAPSRAFVREKRAMAATPADIKEYPNSLGKYLKKFVLPDNADTDNITAVSQDGVLTITVHKKPLPEHMKPKTIQVHRIDGFLAGFLAVLSITRGNFSPQSQKLSFSVTRVDGDCYLLYYASIDIGFGGGRARVTHGCWIWREERESRVL